MGRSLPPPVAMSIAGSDSIGGAGIQADLKTFAAMGCHGACALTAVTAQNTRGVWAAEQIDPELLRAQINAVAGDVHIRATKTGMLGNAEAIEVVTWAVERYHLAPLVVDPVMVAKGGDPLIDDAAVDTLRTWLLPQATVVTPNRREAARLLEWSDAEADAALADVDAAADAARAICERHHIPVCIIKGIRRDLDDGTAESVDVCWHANEVRAFANPWQDTVHVHGSGCTYSAAVTAALARGEELYEALELAGRVVSAAIAAGAPIGAGRVQPVNPMNWLTWSGGPGPSPSSDRPTIEGAPTTPLEGGTPG